ncbi:hypothetical protein ACRDU6_13030 [Mycolicibacterium sp. ELW1]|uniref:hypothetical protein n=1 Tax=Mycobacteriaceae TaxID=1762 RepID=UPI001AF02753|nr:hypothetical protein [Mycobacterium sp. ELW1]
MTDGSPSEELDDECTLPPDPPLPADQLGRYSPERDYYSETQIAEYVEAEAHHDDETVQHAERIKVEYVLGTPYEAWDVTTDKDRYWVFTNLTNLYSQKHFPSLDYTLSFHIGLMARIRSKDEAVATGTTPFDEVFRRLSQAEEALDRAVEVVDFQGVGMQLREAMISLIAAARRRTDLPADVERPQDSNVKMWGEILWGHFYPGSSNKDVRVYLKATTDKAWDLVNWLTHHRNASKTVALIATQAVETILLDMARTLSRERRDRIDQCPLCESRAVRTFFDRDIGPDGGHFENCSECGWSSHPGHDVTDFNDLDPIALCEAQLEAARSVHESWVRSGNELMIEFTANSVAALEEQIKKLRAAAQPDP